MNFVVKLPHLAYCTIFFKQDLISVARFVIVLSHVPIVNNIFQDLPALVELSFVWSVVDRGGFTDHKISS
jgi:hypothetical protein